ncbi:FAD binding domain-containing protein [Daedaleopsis nitida]|nr:FAD binding domain-containing protein [Daedaleopsis nitida]
MSFPADNNVDVLIIGAGPAGLMCANALARAGVKVRIIDKRSVGVAAGQADGIQPRTTEVLQSYGLADSIIREGGHFYRAAFYNPGPDGGIVRSDRTPAIASPTARYPYLITRHQGGIESLFHSSMEPMGLFVQRSTIPTGIEISQDESVLNDPRAYPVKVTLKRLDREENEIEVVKAKFVVGCDGAHSWVRNTLGIKLDGDQTGISPDSFFGVVDMVVETDFPDARCWSFLHSNHGVLMNIPREGDLMRYYIQLPEDTDYVDKATGRVDKTRASPEKLIERAQKIFQPFSMKQAGPVEWWTIYIIGQRVAQTYSVHDRVFIAGDACHTHSPKSGQGMNASMNDTHNLAWKLAYVLRGWAPMSLLKTYEAERLKFARDLIAFDKRWSGLMRSKPRSEENPDGITHEEFVDAFQTFSGFSSGVGIRYEPSTVINPAHQALASKLVVGERMVPHVFVQAADIRPVNIHDRMPSDTRFKALFFTGDLAAAETKARLRALADELEAPESFLHRYGQEDYRKVFDILCICTAKKEDVDYTDVPKTLRPHWTKVLLDDTDMHGREGGGGFAAYGIKPEGGVVVIVRPDGYVGMVAPFDRLDDISAYFASFVLGVSGP